MRNTSPYFAWFACAATVLLFSLTDAKPLIAKQPAIHPGQPITLVVMDPLCDKLACDCVQGYAQRKYEFLGKFLGEKLGREVKVFWGESISSALEEEVNKTADIVIGKHSVIESEAKYLKRNLLPVAQLTGADGGVTQTGLIVVRSQDSAAKVADLKGYRIFFGPADCDEKYLAPMKLLRDAGVEIPASPETSAACSAAATKLMELDPNVNAAAVISSYAEPLLAGCGTIQKGDLRVIGISDEVPFVTAFLSDTLPESTRTSITSALMDFGSDPAGLKALETKSGFVPFHPDPDPKTGAAEARQTAAKKKIGANHNDVAGWPQWRGPHRDGICRHLPAKLPEQVSFRWQTELSSEGIGGIAATDQFVIVGSRDISDTQDVFSCHQMQNGDEVWKISYPAVGDLDYGNSPRATPLVTGEYVVMLGALGNLTVARVATGEILWQTDLVVQFDGTIPTWGFCGSPIQIVVEKDGNTSAAIVVQPGAPDASLVALDVESGEIIWKSEGNRPGYSSFILATIHGRQQLIGYDENSLGGWDLTGRRLWEMTPEKTGDFNVPTPLLVGGQLFVATENNGSRLFDFDSDGKLSPKYIAKNDELCPDTHSPVVAGDKILGVHYGLYCLQSANLKLITRLEDEVFSEYSSAISDGKRRVLFTSIHGELVLVETGGAVCKIKSRLQLSDSEEILSHPAIVGNRLIVRIGKRLCCLELE